MNALQVGGSIAVGLGVTAAVGIGGALVEGPMVNGEWSQANGDFFAAGFGTVMGVMGGAALGVGGLIHGNPYLAAAGAGLTVGSIAARIGARYVDA